MSPSTNFAVIPLVPRVLYRPWSRRTVGFCTGKEAWIPGQAAKAAFIRWLSHRDHCRNPPGTSSAETRVSYRTVCQPSMQNCGFCGWVSAGFCDEEEKPGLLDRSVQLRTASPEKFHIFSKTAFLPR